MGPGKAPLKTSFLAPGDREELRGTAKCLTRIPLPTKWEWADFERFARQWASKNNGGRWRHDVAHVWPGGAVP
eukprot:7411823-Pyramimonas_sp.AAC.1